MEDYFSYNRVLIENGEIWRVLTGHFVHWTMLHWVGNIAGLMILARILREYYSWFTLIKMIIYLALLISAALYLLSPDVLVYRGFSGILYGLSGWVIILLLGQSEQRRIGMFFGMILLWKVIYETIDGPLYHYDGFTTVTDAHLYGLLFGFALGIIYVNNANERRI